MTSLVNLKHTIDECCGKIDLFRFQNRFVHIVWWKCCQVYQVEGLFHERWSKIWLFWYKIHGSTLNRTNLTQFWRPKIYQFFNLEQVNFHVTFVSHINMASYTGYLFTMTLSVWLQAVLNKNKTIIIFVQFSTNMDILFIFTQEVAYSCFIESFIQVEPFCNVLGWISQQILVL